MLKTERAREHKMKREDKVKAFRSFDVTGDHQEPRLETQLDALEHRHHAIATQYAAKIREMTEIIRRQAAQKEELTKQIASLSQVSHQQQAHLSALASRLHQAHQEDRSRHHLNMVASAYLVHKQPLPPPQKERNGRATLFLSEKLKGPRQQASRSEAARNGEYMLYRSPEGMRRRAGHEGRQNQRVQN